MSADLDARLQELVQLARDGRTTAFIERAWELEPADLGDVLAALDEDERVALVRLLPAELSSQALIEMPEDAHAEETLAALDPGMAADIVEELEDDDAADILGELEPEQQERILAEVEDRRDVDRLLRYDEETAGGLMTTRLVTVTDLDTVALALEAVRRQAEDVEDVTEIFVVDTSRRLVGALSFKQLVVSPTGRLVRDVMDDADVRVDPDVDQEEVARIMARYNVPSVPVVDAGGRLIGRVTYDDVIDVAEAEATEDLLRFGGVSPDEGLAAGWGEAVRSRLPWLYVNLLTAFLAAAVVFFFKGSIERIAVLAVWMPIIAGMGGNAGTQALAVTVRRLSLGQVPSARVGQVITKELLVGAVNGAAIGIAVAGVAVLLGESWRLGMVVFLAMTLNLFVAGLAGSFVPVLLERAGIDPAVASSIFVTTFTDVCGFGLLLGLATAVLL
ncbi:MAG: magnesium transporter [Gemmatimonadetes bacterium]|nr:magnesium transporter [Gemmatimonadota bacterium]MCB9517506.1 magnesium transporter [Gemmatimonadales bacterium]MCA9761537.1 magnesium transporter [Gemmatimonadota bacterium]MCA9767272.1 magnesium transporter [Gemmatimonadota bacterium]HPF60866.1 magnesium transporter [Gemmatimonadales bacterium]